MEVPAATEPTVTSYLQLKFTRSSALPSPPDGHGPFKWTLEVGLIFGTSRGEIRKALGGWWWREEASGFRSWERQLLGGDTIDVHAPGWTTGPRQAGSRVVF